MRVVFVACLLFAQLFAAHIEHHTIGNQSFMFTIESYDVYDSKGEVLRVYKEKRNNDLIFMFSLILKDQTGACSDKSIEEGYYEVNATSITLYTRWERRGKAYDAPYGGRIQVYRLTPDNDLKRISSKLYIETEREGYNENSGMKFLFWQPQNEKEKEALASYVRSVEHQFKGEFLFGNAATKLMQEVNAAMIRKMKRVWR